MASTRSSVSLAGIAFLAGATLVGSAQSTHAATVFLETLIDVNYGCVPGVSCLNEEDPVDEQIPGPIAPLTEWGDYSQGWGLNTLDEVYGVDDQQLIASAAAYADFGLLQVRAAAEYDLTGLVDPELRFVVANAQFGDTLTVNGGSLNGQQGRFDVSLTLDGDVTTTGSGGAGAIVVVLWESSLSGGNQPFFYFGDQPGTTLTQSIPIIFGQPFFYSVYMAAAAGTLGPDGSGGVEFIPQTDEGYGSSNFFNTLEITSMIPTLPDGTPVLDATFASESGTRYTIEGVVPEPGTLLLFGTGLAMGIRRSRRRIV